LFFTAKDVSRWASGESQRILKFFSLGLASLSLLLTPLPAFTLPEIGPLPSVDVRRTVAKQWVSTFTTLDRQIQTLSPSQERWLQTEYHDQIATAGNRYTPRALAATNSLEYQIFIVKPRNAEIIDVFTRIATGNVRDKNQEIALWSFAASWFIDAKYWQSLKNLVDRGTVQKKIGDMDGLYFENSTLRAKAFLLRIVIPHLEGRLP
jgi:hypothetical protein